jgi:hypothetical protein
MKGSILEKKARVAKVGVVLQKYGRFETYATKPQIKK